MRRTALQLCVDELIAGRLKWLDKEIWRMADTNTIEEENVQMRLALERVAFLAVGADCKNKSCMHQACSVVRTISGNLKEFMDRPRPKEVVGYQQRIRELHLRLRSIQEAASLP